MLKRPSTAVLLAFAFALPITCASAIDYEKKPILYSESTPDNLITRLQQGVDSGKVKLQYDGKRGYLEAMLRELRLPVSSQILVFSKTSLQAHCISPKTPRAIYFDDRVHLGFVQGGMIEIAVADPALGMVFYTLDQEEADTPKFVRQINRCMNCHGGVRTREVPGLLVRSVFADPGGQPIIAAGSFRTDHTSPLEQRWGGWYVSGTHGDQKHLGAFVLKEKKKPKIIDNSSNMNVTDLSRILDTKPYLSPHSDIVALMVLEHQADAYNFLTRANFETRLVLDGKGGTDDDASKRIEAAADDLVKYLLFSKEAKLTAPIEGTSAFAKEFAARGPRDKLGRSLRDFDLKTRLFSYPCSYLIYSDGYTALPKQMKERVERRLWGVLTGNKDTSADFAHLSVADRQAIVEILRDTRKMPEFWR